MSKIVLFKCLAKQQQALLGSNLLRDNQIHGNKWGHRGFKSSVSNMSYLIFVAYALKNPPVKPSLTGT
jgi:hypothetical protein